MSSRIAGMLVCGFTLAPLVACHHGSPVRAEPSPAERTARLEELPGHFPGVDMVRTRTGGFLIRIPGGSFPGGKEPLYVIDGSPVEVEPRRGVDWLKPPDIERIQVLKYAAETAVYGPRGVNGVIVITTKRGR